MHINVRGDVRAITRDLTRLQRRQVPFATARALTDTARVAQRAMGRAIERAFVAPTPQTKRAAYATPATKTRPIAAVGIKDKGARGGRSPAQYLQAQMSGGTRRDKGLDVALRRRGLLPIGYQAVPTRAIKRDRYGNITRATARQILSGLDRRYSPRTTVRFVYMEADGMRGIWRTSKTGARPLLLFVRTPKYQRRLDFYGVAERAARRAFPAAMRRALRRALETAR